MHIKLIAIYIIHLGIAYIKLIELSSYLIKKNIKTLKFKKRYKNKDN